MERNVSIPTGWSDITLERYETLRKVFDVKKDIEAQERELVAVMSGLSRKDVESLDMASYSAILQRISFLKDEPKPKYPTGKLVWGGNEYRCTINPDTMTAGQFLDYRSILQHTELDRREARLLACFIIPEGKEYNDGYRVEDVVDVLWKNMSVEEARGISDFFTVWYRALLQTSLRYLKREIRRSKGMPEQEKRLLLDRLAQLQAMHNDIG